MELSDVFQRLGTALGLGLLVGLQRERSGSPLAGIRTFPLIAILGALCGWIGTWAIGGGFIALAAVIVAAAIQHPDGKNPGITTEIAMLVIFAVGAALAAGPIAPAIAIGGAVALLLHLKEQMHRFAAKLGDQDFTGIMQFVVVSLVILPALPDRYFGPFNILNPHRLWWTVVLIVGISLAGFLIYRFFGKRAGTVAAGILGGLISSTATTVSYARKTKSETGAAPLAAIIILIASTVVFARVLLIIGVTAPSFLPTAALPLTLMFLGAALISVLLWKLDERPSDAMLPQGNPTELKAALLFVAIYALVLMAVAFAKDRFGSSGLYLVAVLSGLTDMDAITLSVSQMVQEGRLNPQEGWRMILTASLSNLVFKTGIVALVGSRQLFKRVAIAFSISAVIGLAIIFLWPN
jgi:uncharacterized membrane protein (DUF4010 family)